MSEQTDPAVAHLDHFYHRQVDRIATQLRDMADAIEHLGRDVRPSRRDNKSDYTQPAIAVVSKVQWGVANLPLDVLLAAASDADREVRRPEVPHVEG